MYKEANTVVCDVCERSEPVRNIDYIPDGWRILCTAPDGRDQIHYDVCSKDCLLKADALIEAALRPGPVCYCGDAIQPNPAANDEGGPYAPWMHCLIDGEDNPSDDDHEAIPTAESVGF